MDKQTRKSVRRILAKDKRMIRLSDSFTSNSIFSLPFEELKAELKMLHATRTLANLRTNDANFVDKLARASTNDHAIRSRITEILVDCAAIRNSLKRSLDAMESYILNEYTDELKSLKTKDERKVFVSTLLNNYYEYLSNSTEMVEICHYYLDCIDKGGFMSRDLVTAYTLVRKYEPS